MVNIVLIIVYNFQVSFKSLKTIFILVTNKKTIPKITLIYILVNKKIF